VSARERKEGEFGTDGARTTAVAERFTSAAVVDAAARLAGRRRVQGRRVLVWAAHATSEDERSTGKRLPAAESFGQPAMVQRPEVDWRRRVREGEVQGCTAEGKRARLNTALAL
jgi:hypothetical protein